MSGLLRSQTGVISAHGGHAVENREACRSRLQSGVVPPHSPYPPGRISRWMGFLSVLCLTLLLQSACGGREAPLVPSPVPLGSADKEYRIGPADVIEVMVWKNPDLSRQVTVRPDGQISLPLIKSLYVTGRTTSELNELITDRLRGFYKDPPEVSVIVQQANSHAIYVLGNVLTQGRFVVGHEVTLLQAIALAGGFQQYARRDQITVRRPVADGEDLTFDVRYTEVLAKREKNLVLQPGDVIIVP